ncbi:AMP-binding protein [Nocardia sp. NPDC056952]|uniref:AMP-binding protein n=1 Tax=Nocardia sp. NPDC056952 TaxID=3345979 RepID=UPI003630A367
MTVLHDLQERCKNYGSEAVIRRGSSVMTRSEFFRSTEELADALLRLDVGVGSRVALAIPPSSELLIAIAAVWTCGSSYVPLASSEVKPKLDRMISASRPTVVITSGREASLTDTGRPTVMFNLGSPLSVSGARTLGNEREHDGNEAYVIFTSGSTGDPKGVSVGHKALSSYVHAVCERFVHSGEQTAVPLYVPPTFDSSLTQLMPPLVTHAVAEIFEGKAPVSVELAEFLRTTRSPLLVKMTPTLARAVGDLVEADVVKELQGSFVVGGEAVDYQDVGWLRNSRARIFNHYGPTEATVGCTFHEIQPSEPRSGKVPIGRPHPGARVIVDAQSDSDDAVGELVVGGPCVATGYINYSNDRFETRSGERFYRTGDQVRVDATGQLRYLGRIDGQIKIGGVRIEPGEVESAVREAASGASAAVILSENTLVAFVERSTDRTAVQIEDALIRTLPPVMRPTKIEVIEKLPLTSHGKVDRKALEEQANRLFTAGRFEASRPGSPVGSESPRWQRSGPRDMARIVKHLTAVFSKISDSTVAVDDDLFQLGIRSVETVVVSAVIKREYGVDVSAVDIFDNPTPLDLAALIVDRMG